jgi:polar amino acid transport system substrate-binding protein
MQYFTQSDPVKVFAESINTDNGLVNPDDNLSLIIKFKDGSIGNLIYVANGDKSLPKEMIEIFCAGKVATINDFKDGKIYKDGKITTLKSTGKGHKEELEAFINAVQSGLESPISFRSICLTTLTTFKIKDSLVTGMPQNISLNEL